MSDQKKDNIKKTAIELLENAYGNKQLSVTIPIKVDDDVSLDAVLYAPDMVTIQKEQNKRYEIELAQLKSDPDIANMPPNLDKWEEQIKRQADPKVQKRLRENKPTTLAAQLASENSLLAALQGILPKFLRDRETDQLLFPTPDEQRRFVKIIYSNPPLLQLVMGKYVELMEKLNQITEDAKN
jgi:hypothetical protein